MTNPDLAVILRRFYALVAASMVPAGALLLSTGWRELAVGLGSGALIATLNAAMLARRINRSATERVAQAQRVMQQGMGIRFALILLATVVIVKMVPSAIPAFLLGLVVTMALMIAVAARALLASASGVAHFEAVVVGAGPCACPGRLLARTEHGVREEGQAQGPAPTATRYLARTGDVPKSFLISDLKRSPRQ